MIEALERRGHEPFSLNTGRIWFSSTVRVQRVQVLRLIVEWFRTRLLLCAISQRPQYILFEVELDLHVQTNVMAQEVFDEDAIDRFEGWAVLARVTVINLRHLRYPVTQVSIHDALEGAGRARVSIYYYEYKRFLDTYNLLDADGFLMEEIPDLLSFLQIIRLYFVQVLLVNDESNTDDEH